MCPDFLQHLLISIGFSKRLRGCLPASLFTAPLAAADPARVLDRVRCDQRTAALSVLSDDGLECLITILCLLNLFTEHSCDPCLCYSSLKNHLCLIMLVHVPAVVENLGQSVHRLSLISATQTKKAVQVCAVHC
jgi:hypothetical protein